MLVNAPAALATMPRSPSPVTPAMLLLGSAHLRTGAAPLVVTALEGADAGRG